MKKDLASQNYELMSNDAANWRGPFYFNKKDSRVIVPKNKRMLGYTFNFGNIKTYLILLIFLAVIIFVAIWQS